MFIENANKKLEIPDICKSIALTKLPKMALLDEGLIKTLKGKIDDVIKSDPNQSALMIVRDSSSPIPEEMKKFLEIYVRMNPDCEVLFY